MMMFWYGSGWAWWQVGLMWVAMIAFWGVPIWTAYAIIANFTRKPGVREDGDDARRILDQRLVRGEISPEEYQRLRDLLDSGTHAASGAGSGP